MNESAHELLVRQQIADRIDRAGRRRVAVRFKNRRHLRRTGEI